QSPLQSDQVNVEATLGNHHTRLFVPRIPRPALKWTAGVQCIDQKLRDCESKILKYFQSLNETGYAAFCEDVTSDRDCPTHVSEDCKNYYPGASAQYTLFMKRFHHWCSRTSKDRKMWFKIAECASKNPKVFHKCLRMRIMKNETGNSIDCEYYDYLYCMSEAVLKSSSCEGREMLSKHIEGAVHESYQEYCKGINSTSIIMNYWILDLLAFLSLALSHKILL
ncbi:hypothetical protein AVEN_270510-2-1, partial [Araneus ventricosus]